VGFFDGFDVPSLSVSSSLFEGLAVGDFDGLPVGLCVGDFDGFDVDVLSGDLVGE